MSALADVVAAVARDGWARLPERVPDELCAALRARADGLMRGEAHPPGMFFQHDAPDGQYASLALGRGWIGPSPAYRKIEKLERDPTFRRWIDPPALAPWVRALLDEPGPVRLARAVLWTKAASGGTELPWHQDDGAFWGIAPGPRLTLWTALDDAPAASGCLEVVPGSHRAGLATATGGVLPPALVAQIGATTLVPARAGEVLALHNHLWHRSGRNTTGVPRRALSVCYLGGASRCTRRRRPRAFVELFAPHDAAAVPV